MPRDLTEDERRAIRGLKRLAKTWPKSLKLFSWSGSLVIFCADDDLSDANSSMLDHIDGIPNDGGDP